MENKIISCTKCTRLADFIAENRFKYPDFYNAPVPSFGDKNASLLIVGLAPGLKGANRTGRPFTGDYAGDLLYKLLFEFGFSNGKYKAMSDDGLVLNNARITNAVRCVPPENKVSSEEIANCNDFLKQEIFAMPNLKVIIALGAVAHNAIMKAFTLKKSQYAFAHCAEHKLSEYTLIDSYHCSRYNTNTGRLTEEMFRNVFEKATKYL